MPGFGDFLLGFSNAYSNDLVAERERQRKAEDADLETRGKILQHMIGTMSTNPSNAPLVEQAWKDYLDTMGAVGKKRKYKGGAAGMRGETDLPSSVFLDMVRSGKVPAFGGVDLDMKPMFGGQGGGAAVPPPPQPDQSAFTSHGGDIPSRQINAQPVNPEGPGKPVTLGPVGPPPQPQPTVPYEPGTNRMNQAVNQTANEAAMNPELAFPTAHYRPGMMLGPEDNAKVEGIVDYTKSRLKQRALAANIVEAGGSKSEVLDALIPGSSEAHSPFTQYGIYMDQNGHQFPGMIFKGDGSVRMQGNPSMTIDGALPYKVQSSTYVDPNNNMHVLYRNNLPPSATGQPGWEDVDPGLQARAPAGNLKVVLGPDGQYRYVSQGEAVGARAPMPGVQDPEAIKAKAGARYQEQLGKIENRLRSTGPDRITPDAAEALKQAAQEEYDATIGYNRSEQGGTLSSAQTQKNQATGALEYNPQWLNGKPWYVTKGLPTIAAGTGPTWNALALARMKQYLEDLAKSQGKNLVITNEHVQAAMKREAARTDAGLR